MAKAGLNLISLDLPYPPDYGGAIDIFYKVKALYEQGITVHLHCFTYGRSEIGALGEYCASVTLYQRKTGLWSNFSLLPYITYSRRDSSMIANLRSNDYPILFEGLHTVYPLVKKLLPYRRVLLRAHNIEHNYYYALARKTSSPVKKLFFLKEAFLLKRLLRKLEKTTLIGAISPADTDYLTEQFPETFWLPPFHANEEVVSQAGVGEYALYHGNLSVAENSEVAFDLIRCFAGKEVPLIIAGKDPAPELVAAVAGHGNIEVTPNPAAVQMQRLIQEAQVILLLTNQATGIKLKLIESLFRGRHCLANLEMVRQTTLEPLVELVTMETVYAVTNGLMEQPFSVEVKEKRVAVLRKNFNNQRNAQLLTGKLGIEVNG